MKEKIKKIIPILIFTLFIVPSMVLAFSDVEDSGQPTENNAYPKAYFLLYPNGVTATVENLADEQNLPEILVYEGYSNANGEIVLENWQTTGQLRIVETVPAGYTAMNKELNVDLSQTSTTGFINYKGLINPNTGRKTLYVIVLLAIIVLVLITLKQRTTHMSNKEEKKTTDEDNKKEKKEEVEVTKEKKKNKSKKTVALLIIALLLVVLTNTKATTKNFIITTKDSHGNVMPNVEVKVYAKPIRVEHAPYIKYDANGGEFMDGTTEMIFRLPADECSEDAFYNSLSEEELNYLEQNRWGATREGYYTGSYDISKVEDLLDFAADLANDPTHFSDSNKRVQMLLRGARDNEVSTNLVSGQVIYTEWTPNPEAHVVTINGNGAYRMVGSKKLYSYKAYSADLELLSDRGNLGFFNGGFINGIYVGYDDNKSCSHIPNGIHVKGDYRLSGDTYYACWNNKPDGIYVNDTYYSRGNIESCFSYSNPSYRSPYISFNAISINTEYEFAGSTNQTIEINGLGTNEMYINTIIETENWGGFVRRVEESSIQAKITFNTVRKVEFVNNGQVIISINEDEIESTPDEKGNIVNRITNSSKVNAINSYIGQYGTNCYTPPGKLDDFEEKK